ncbi:MAG: MOP flippase family protein [Candidatus Krumholzibacteria bacterium]|nr:MOP flippase family protein [Candidatus Krumholzibacteria bacterium]
MNDGDRQEGRPEEAPNELRAQAAAGARWMSVASVARMVTQLAHLFILGRILAPEDFGLMAMVTFVVVLGQAMGDAGVSNAIIHHQKTTRAELSSLYWLGVIVGLAVFALAWFCAPLVVRLYHEPRLEALVRLAAVVFLVAPIGQQFQMLLEKELRFRRVALVEVAAAPAGLVVGIALALRGQGVYSLVWALLASTAVKAVLLAATGWWSWRPALHFAPRDTRRFLRFGTFQVLERVFNQVGSQLDKLMLGVLVGAGPLGYYDIAQRLALRPFLVINPAITRVAFPVFSRVQEDDAQLRAGYLQVMRLIGLAIIPLYVAMAVLAEPIIRVGPGEKWVDSIPLLQILAVVGLVLGLGNPMGSLVLAKGRAGLTFALNVLRMALDFGAILLAWRWGLAAVALAVLAVRLGVLFPLGFWIRWWLVRMRPGEYLGAIAPFAASAAVMGAVMLVLMRAVSWPGHLVELLAALALGATVYLGLLYWRQRPLMARIWRLVRS